MKMKKRITILMGMLLCVYINVYSQCPAAANLAATTCSSGSTLSSAGTYNGNTRITSNTTISGNVTIQNGGSLSICGAVVSFGSLTLSNSTNTVIINAGASLTLGTTGTPSNSMTWDGTGTVMNYGTLILNDLVNFNNSGITLINAGTIISNDNGGLNISGTSKFINRGTAQFVAVTTQRPNVIIIENGSSTTFNGYTHNDPNSGNALPIVFCGAGSASTTFTGNVNVSNASNVKLININGQTVTACASGATYSPSGASFSNLGTGVTNGASGAAGTITGTATVCQGQTGVVYTVPAITNATGYVWSLPSGATITSGSNTNSITVSFSGTASSGNINVYGTSACGNGATSPNYAITTKTAPAAAGTITGTREVCKPATGVVYSVPAIANATGYVWTLPAGATITAGSNTNTITVSFSSAAVFGTISVYGTSCSNGTASTYKVFPVVCDADGDGISNAIDLDADNDGIPNAVECTNPIYNDPFGDADGDGIRNYYDDTPGGSIVWVDSNGDGINDNYDYDLDGIINCLDLDSDNDGIPDVIEAYGVDANGDGMIDNFTDANGDGLSDNITLSLLNPSFESPAQSTVGNNLLGTTTFNGWTMTGGGTFNIVKTNGTLYTGGPDNAQDGTQYVDITNNAGYVQQNFTLNTRRAIFFGGYFSSREQSGYVNWTGVVEIVNVATGTVVATSSSRNFTISDGAEEQLWYFLSGTATLPPGTYTYRAFMGDWGNFDNAILMPGSPDFDGDGIANEFDLDSDNDGIPDIVESGGTDANNDAKVDGFTDANGNGLHDALEGSGALLKSGPDTNGDGIADSWPNKNIDLLGYPNLYDLDSDGDGILDVVEAGFGGTVSYSNGIVTGSYTNGWANTVKALGTTTLNLRNTDGVGQPDYLDIDSDNDGITDNIEAQSTTSYKVPSDADTDYDGINDIYELASQVGVYGGAGLTPFDYDSDGIPDYRDTDSDNDSAPDRNEGDRNSPFKTITQATIDASGDSDGDGLMDVFDNVNISSLTAGNYYLNTTMSNMGPLGNFNGPTPSGSYIQLQQSDPAADRDWRNVSILPLQVINFTVSYQAPIATLKWDAVNEYQTNYYQIEISTNGVDFTALANVTAKNTGNTSYAYQHSVNNQTSNTLYYRIRQTDKDGKVFYTKIIALKLDKTVKFTAYPNPFINYLQVSYNADKNGSITLLLVTADGKTAKSQNFMVVKGNNSLLFDNVATLSAGTYFLKIAATTYEPAIVTIIKK